ncbi:MAG: hypothetical protein WBV61_10165 [Rhodanobacteraceae bacterium]
MHGFDLVEPDTAADKQMVNAGRLAYQALLQRGLRAPALSAMDTLRHADISPFSEYDLIRLYTVTTSK